MGTTLIGFKRKPAAAAADDDDDIWATKQSLVWTVAGEEHTHMMRKVWVVRWMRVCN